MLKYGTLSLYLFAHLSCAQLEPQGSEKTESFSAKEKIEIVCNCGNHVLNYYSNSYKAPTHCYLDRIDQKSITQQDQHSKNPYKNAPINTQEIYETSKIKNFDASKKTPPIASDENKNCLSCLPCFSSNNSKAQPITIEEPEHFLKCLSCLTTLGIPMVYKERPAYLMIKNRFQVTLSADQ